jgi:hypothetical protein
VVVMGDGSMDRWIGGFGDVRRSLLGVRVCDRDRDSYR